MLDFSRQYQQIRAEIVAAIEQVCDSQHFILGREVQQFETDCARFCDVAHAVACASGTDALWLAMAAADVGPGDAVLTSPFTFFSTVSSILRVGARPLFADIDPKRTTWTPNKQPPRWKTSQRRSGSAPSCQSICTANVRNGIGSRSYRRRGMFS